MTSIKKSLSSIFLGLYLFGIGFLWLGNVGIITSMQAFSSIRYDAGIQTLKSAEYAERNYEFKRKSQRIDYYVQYENLRKYNEKIKKVVNGEVPFHFLLMGGVDVGVAVMFMFSGVLLLIGSENFMKYLRLGWQGIVLHFVVLIAGGLYDIVPMMSKVNALMQVFEMKESLTFSNIIPWPVYLLPIVGIGLIVGIYVFVPKIVIRKSKSIAMFK